MGISIEAVLLVMTLVSPTGQIGHAVKAFNSPMECMENKKIITDVEYRQSLVEEDMEPEDIEPRFQLVAVTCSKHDIPLNLPQA